MNVLVVYCHPCADSFVAAVKDAALSGLAKAGHAVRIVDLYGDGFEPAMSAEERRRYHDAGVNEAPVADHVAHLKWAEALLFIYPTWWYNLPAMLKGWLDRAFVPHVAFVMPTATQGIRGNLRNIRRIDVVTTCGASWHVSKLMGEPGRRTLTRGLRAICHPFCRTSYTALYKMDTVSPERRTRYLAEVSARCARIR
nr:NAD(P)H-dependent oxidoreductase [Mongoliimonas terrestris]